MGNMESGAQAAATGTPRATNTWQARAKGEGQITMDNDTKQAPTIDVYKALHDERERLRAAQADNNRLLESIQQANRTCYQQKLRIQEMERLQDETAKLLGEHVVALRSAQKEAKDAKAQVESLSEPCYCCRENGCQPGCRCSHKDEELQ